MALDRVPGASNTQAAMLMGNSVQAWAKHYDVNCNVRDSQAAVNSTAQVWRMHMLEKGVQGSAAVPLSSDAMLPTIL